MEPNRQDREHLRNSFKALTNSDELADAQFFQDEASLIESAITSHTGRAFAAADLETVEKRVIPGIDAYLLFFSGTCIGMVHIFPPDRPSTMPAFIYTPVPVE